VVEVVEEKTETFVYPSGSAEGVRLAGFLVDVDMPSESLLTVRYKVPVGEVDVREIVMTFSSKYAARLKNLRAKLYEAVNDNCVKLVAGRGGLYFLPFERIANFEAEVQKIKHELAKLEVELQRIVDSDPYVRRAREYISRRAGTYVIQAPKLAERLKVYYAPLVLDPAVLVRYVEEEAQKYFVRAEEAKEQANTMLEAHLRQLARKLEEAKAEVERKVEEFRAHLLATMVNDVKGRLLAEMTNVAQGRASAVSQVIAEAERVLSSVSDEELARLVELAKELSETTREQAKQRLVEFLKEMGVTPEFPDDRRKRPTMAVQCRYCNYMEQGYIGELIPKWKRGCPNCGRRVL